MEYRNCIQQSLFEDSVSNEIMHLQRQPGNHRNVRRSDPFRKLALKPREQYALFKISILQVFMDRITVFCRIKS